MIGISEVPPEFLQLKQLLDVLDRDVVPLFNAFIFELLNFDERWIVRIHSVIYLRFWIEESYKVVLICPDCL